jgi:hypothetical protein
MVYEGGEFIDLSGFHLDAKRRHLLCCVLIYPEVEDDIGTDDDIKMEISGISGGQHVIRHLAVRPTPYSYRHCW